MDSPTGQTISSNLSVLFEILPKVIFRVDFGVLLLLAEFQTKLLAVFKESQIELFNLNLCFDLNDCALFSWGRWVHSLFHILSKVVRLIVLYY